MITPDIIGWIGNIFFVYGVFALGHKQVRGFWCNMVGNILYAGQGAMLELPSLIVLSALLVFLNIKGVLAWTKTKNES